MEYLPIYEPFEVGISEKFKLFRQLYARDLTKGHIHWSGFLWKENNNYTLCIDIVALTVPSDPTCICAIARTSEQLELFARDLCNLFHVNHIVIQDSYRPISQIVTVEIYPGENKRFDLMREEGYSEDPGCGTHPNIPGLLSWRHINTT